MSDTWYREPPDLPPIRSCGLLWTWDGRCLNPEAAEPSWLDEWPEDLRFEAFRASFAMAFVDEYHRQFDRALGEL